MMYDLKPRIEFKNVSLTTFWFKFPYTLPIVKQQDQKHNTQGFFQDFPLLAKT